MVPVYGDTVLIRNASPFTQESLINCSVLSVKDEWSSFQITG